MSEFAVLQAQARAELSAWRREDRYRKRVRVFVTVFAVCGVISFIVTLVGLTG